MFEDDGLSKACEPYGATLRRARLLPDDSVNTARLIRLVVATFLLTAVGFTKVVVAIDAGRSNVGFLIFLMIAALVTVAAISFPRLTVSGREMIQSVQSLYSGLRSRTSPSTVVAAGNAGGAGVEPMMLAAVFGVGALAGSEFAYAQGLFPGVEKRRGSCASDGDCGSSCSSSDGGSSSSCSSGSSCGSGCGGGCGGCGGS